LTHFLRRWTAHDLGVPALADGLREDVQPIDPAFVHHDGVRILVPRDRNRRRSANACRADASPAVARAIAAVERVRRKVDARGVDRVADPAGGGVVRGSQRVGRGIGRVSGIRRSRGFVRRIGRGVRNARVTRGACVNGVARVGRALVGPGATAARGEKQGAEPTYDEQPNPHRAGSIAREPRDGAAAGSGVGDEAHSSGGARRSCHGRAHRRSSRFRPSALPSASVDELWSVPRAKLRPYRCGRSERCNRFAWRAHVASRA
jgi:hypothetical protein